MTDTQFTTRDLPWMQLGTTVDEAVTAAQAIELAGLDWEVALRKDGYQTASGNWRVDSTKRKVVRVDTEEPLGTVSPGYEILQYGEAFDFMDGINPEFVSAGSLRGGKQAFVVVKAPDHSKLETLNGDDPHDLYVVLRSSHDGTRAVEVNILPLRGLCMNMMPASLLGVKQKWSIRHTKNLRFKLEQAQAVIAGLDQYTDAYNKTAEQLAQMNLTIEQVRELLTKTVPDYIKQPDKQVAAIMDVYEHSTRNGYRGTGWGVLNAVSEYHEHFRGSDDRSAETRWFQGLDGTTTKAINRTLRVLQRAA